MVVFLEPSRWARFSGGPSTDRLARTFFVCSGRSWCQARVFAAAFYFNFLFTTFVLFFFLPLLARFLVAGQG